MKQDALLYNSNLKINIHSCLYFTRPKDIHFFTTNFIKRNKVFKKKKKIETVDTGLREVVKIIRSTIREPNVISSSQGLFPM